MKIASFVLIFFVANIYFSAAQNAIEVPDHIYFAGMKLNLSKSLRSNLAAQVQTIQKNKTYFQAKVDLADMYFPIIERVFTEEDIPLDFKYLAIQESSLQSDAVSTSNAVGYWQFKKESATEVGLLVNNEVDERKHIVEASRGAARYLKKNYLVMTNWIYAVIAYNTGLGGAKPFTKSKYIGANEMDLDDDLHWYAIKFLAHKLAYEDKVGYGKPDLYLLEYNLSTAGKSLAKVANETNISEDLINKYNKWALKSKIPSDKNSVVLLPVPYADKEQIIAKLGINQTVMPVKDPAVSSFEVSTKNDKHNLEGIFLFSTNNGLDGVVAKINDNVLKLAAAGEISVDKFRQYNEMQPGEEVKKGQIYYFESKKSKAIVPFHTAKAGESLWDIAQIYGMKLSQLKKKNRIQENEVLQEGRLLYLRFSRPLFEPVLIAEKPIEAKLVPQTKPVIVTSSSVNKESGDLPKSNAITVNSVNISDLPVVVEPTQPQPETILPVSNFAGVDIEVEPDKPKYIPIPRLNFPLPDSAMSYHLINQGQTLYSLSRYYEVKVDSLKSWNKLGAEGVKVGQRIITSKSNKSLNSKFQLIAVEEGQTLQSIADNLHTTVNDLVIWNDKKKPTVFVGEILKFK